MTDRIRIIGGFIELNHERVAQILPQADERTLREEIESINTEVLEEREQELYNEAHQTAEDDYEAKLSNFNDRIDSFFDKLLDDGNITEAQHTLICEGLPSE